MCLSNEDIYGIFCRLSDSQAQTLDIYISQHVHNISIFSTNIILGRGRKPIPAVAAVASRFQSCPPQSNFIDGAAHQAPPPDSPKYRKMHFHHSSESEVAQS